MKFHHLRHVAVMMTILSCRPPRALREEIHRLKTGRFFIVLLLFCFTVVLLFLSRNNSSRREFVDQEKQITKYAK